MIVAFLMIGIIAYYTTRKQEDKEFEEQQVKEQQINTEISEQPIEVIVVTKPNATVDADIVYDEQYYEDVELLAHLLHCENSNEVDGEEATWTTGYVMANRVESPNFPGTYSEVAYQSGQWQPVRDGTLYREEPTDIEWEIAAEIRQHGSQIDRKVVYAAEFTQGNGTYKKIGNTYYCFE